LNYLLGHGGLPWYYLNSIHKEKKMKLKRLAILSAVLVAALSAVQGCRMGYDLEPELDNPGEGVMSKKTADLIFDYEPEGIGVVIIKLKNAAALTEYLNGAAANIQPAAALMLAVEVSDLPTFVIKTIDRRPVIRIADDAFSPAAGADDISTAASAIELPVVVEDLGDNLFNGMETPIYVDIPEAVVDRMRAAYLDNIREEENEAAAGEAGDEILIEVFRRVLAGSAAVVRQITGEGEPELITAGPLVDLEEPGEPGESEEPSTPSTPSGPSAPPPSISYRLGQITGLAPTPGGTPAARVSGTGYSGTVAWSSSNPDWTSELFDPTESYTAVITIISWSGYTLTSVVDNPVPGADTTSIGSQSGAGAVITAIFLPARDSSGGGANTPQLP
jgi:hypothetical protein